MALHVFHTVWDAQYVEKNRPHLCIHICKCIVCVCARVCVCVHMCVCVIAALFFLDYTIRSSYNRSTVHGTGHRSSWNKSCQQVITEQVMERVNRSLCQQVITKQSYMKQGNDEQHGHRTITCAFPGTCVVVGHTWGTVSNLLFWPATNATVWGRVSLGA